MLSYAATNDQQLSVTSPSKKSETTMSAIHYGQAAQRHRTVVELYKIARVNKHTRNLCHY
jgi:hypothetical protein